MKATCTLTALSLIDGLRDELDHLRQDGMDVSLYMQACTCLSVTDHAIRSQYARLHPNEPMPQTATPYEPEND